MKTVEAKDYAKLVRDAQQKATTDTLLFQLHALGLPAPELEHHFHPQRDWRLDLAWPGLKLAVEIEGGVWVNGRHNRAGGFIGDIEKYNALTEAGWFLLRFTTEMVPRGIAAAQIERVIRNLGGMK